MSSHQATDSPSMRPCALSVGTTTHSHDPTHIHTSTASVQLLSTISHPQPLAHEIAQLYETDMNNHLIRGSIQGHLRAFKSVRGLVIVIVV
ncbi:hypothetical protein J001_06254 [Cryptococcus neoformans]|nr:hypothetical protein J004_06264 [Cryptococcus neoformans var. grubii]OXH63831.1 hypothetical protein J001_06254 [Cryptococcus neoformans var. grubii]OXH64383.1 hypothetical protein J000_06261 [Cryptococcus neoformans var. grubii]